MDKPLLPHQHNTINHIEDLKNTVSNLNNFSIVADMLKLLGDSSRIRIFWLLCHCEECVINISSLVDMTSPAVSHHLRQLKDRGLIVSRRDGKEVYYKVADTEECHLLHMTVEKIMEISCPKSLDNRERNCTCQTEQNCNEEHLTAMHEIHEYLIQNLDKRITIEDLAKKFLMNTTTLKELFKTVYGTSLAAHMKEHRLKKAAELLRNTEESIAEIARSVGYESASKFSAAFKDEYGKTPKDYRKE